MSDLISRPYLPAPDKCCQACCFNQGDHEDWCEHYLLNDPPGGGHTTDPVWFAKYKFDWEKKKVLLDRIFGPLDPADLP